MSVELKKMLEDVNTAFEAFKETDGKRAEEVRANGVALADTDEKLVKINTRMDDVLAELEKRAKAPLVPANESDITPEQMEKRKAFGGYLRLGRSEMPNEQRALLGTSDADGGFLIPDDTATGIIMNAYDVAETRPLCNVGTTGRDRVLAPTLSKPVVGWGTKGLGVSDQILNAAREELPVKYLVALALFDEDLLADADADIEAQIFAAFGEALAEAEDDAIFTGDGVQEILGILNRSGILSNAVNSGIAGELVDSTHDGFSVMMEALYSLKKVYRRRAAIACNSTTERVLRQVTDANGNYLWAAPVSAEVPATFMGKRIINPEGLPDIAANAHPIVIGDFSRYWLRDNGGLSIQRATERYIEFGQIAFKVKKRVAGAPVLDEAFAPVKIAV